MGRRFATVLCILGLLSCSFAFTGRGPISETPGVTTRCNRTEACFPFSSQEQYSLIWLCCEDDNGWVGAHFLLPFGTYLFTQSTVATVAQILFSEYIEATGLLLGGNLIIPVTDETKLETWTGSLTGDGTIGFIGIGVAALYARALGAPPLLRSGFRGSFWWKYFLLWALYGAIFLCHLWRTGPDSTLNPGAILATGVHLIYLLGLMPYVTTLGPNDTTGVWRNVHSRRKYTRKSQVWAFFGGWAAIVVAVQAQNFGFQYLPNDWYQVLVSVAVVTVVLLLVWSVRASPGLGVAKKPRTRR